MSEFKKGDVVQPKGGDPKMTVRDVEKCLSKPGEISVKCEWFDAKCELKSGVFDPAQLIKVE